jgi:hypothetical protein
MEEEERLHDRVGREWCTGLVGGHGSFDPADCRLPAVEGARHGGGSVVGSSYVGKRVCVM